MMRAAPRWGALLVLCGVVSPLRAQERSPQSYAVALKASYLPLESVRDGIVRMPSALTRRVAVHRDSVPLQQVLLDIATQAKLGLSYGEDLALSNTIVSLKLTNVSAAEALAAAVRDTKWAVLVTATGQVAVVPAERRVLSSITGRVTDRLTGAAVAGATLTLEGTRLGTTADDSGRYRIAHVPAGSYTLGVRRMGYARATPSVTVATEDATSVDLVLAPSASTLDQVVVTGVPGVVPRRTLGNAITTLQVAQITEDVSNVNVTELLQAKAPGVTILPGGGSPGTGASIRLRGTGSLVAATAPVIYLDGVRLFSGAQGNFWNSWRSQKPGEPASGAGQDALAIDMLNPEDIESIEVIKGPAAATLYGADAANGVIQVITKKGAPGEQRVQWTGKVQAGIDRWAVDRVTNYTTCTPAVVAARLEDGSPRFPGCQGIAAGTLLSARSLDLPGALRDGDVANVNLSVRGGGRGYSFFANADRLQEEGVFYNSSNRRGSARANFALYPSEQLAVSISAGYNRVHTEFPINDDGFGLIQAAMQYRPGYAIDLTRPGARDGFFGGGPEAVYQWNNRLRATRMTLGTTIDYHPTSWSKHRLTVGLDQDDRLAEKFLPPGSIWGGDAGLSERAAPENSQYTIDYAGTLLHRLPWALPSAFSVGVQYASSQFRNTIARGSGLAPGPPGLVSPAISTTGYTEYVDQKSIGAYVQEQVSWRERAFVTGALRMDNNSVFGEEIRHLYYPKLSAAYVITEEPFVRALLPSVDQIKLRVAWGQAGNAPAPFAGQRSFASTVTVDEHGQLVPALGTSSYGNSKIKPERGEEIEVGADAGLFNNRLTLELTYYDKRTKDALMAVAVPPSTGFTGVRLENLGTITNRGLELGVRAIALDRALVRWESQLGVSTNRNRLVSFGYNRDPIALALYAPVQRHTPGYPLGGYWGNFPKRDAAGQLVHDAAGALVGDSAIFIGPPAPTREATLGNTVTLGGKLRLFALLDYKGGHYLYNVKDQYRCWGQPFASTWNRDPTANVPGSCWEVNDPGRPEAAKEIRQQDPMVNNGIFIQRADFIKLRDVSLTYTVPTSWSRRVGSERAAVTLAAHNVAILWKPFYTGPDPEVNFTGVNDPGGQFAFVRVDSWTAPMTRRIVASIAMTF